MRLFAQIDDYDNEERRVQLWTDADRTRSRSIRLRVLGVAGCGAAWLRIGRMMHDGQIEVAAEALASALAAQFTELAGMPIERVDSAGTVVAPFRVGEDVVARLPLVPTDSDAARDVFAENRRMRVVLADHLRVAVPRPLGIGEPFDGYPGIWSVWTWLPGRSLDRLPVARDVRLAADLAELVGAIQALPTAGRSWNGEGRGGRPLADTPWVRESIDRSAHLIDPRKATAVWERALAADPHQGPAVRIHGDPMPGNFLANDGRLTGMVDVAPPTFGDPAADLQPAWVLFERTRTQRVPLRDGAR